MQVLINNVSCIASDRNKGWWMESNLKDEVIQYSNEKELKEKLSMLLGEKDYVLNKKLKFENMYHDNVNGIVGYVVNIMVDVQSNDYSWKKGYFEVWISLTNINNKGVEL